MKKGLQPLQWTFVVLVVTLIIIVFAVNPLQGAIDEAVANNANLAAQEIRSAVNILQTMPDITTYRIDLDARNCKIWINQNEVIVEMKGINATLGLIQTGKEIDKFKMDCSQKNFIEITREGNKIKFT